jgi:hypothetical protein
MIRANLTRTRLGILLAVAAGVLLGAIFGQPGSGRAASSVVPTNKTLPTISGVPSAGTVLTAHRGTWSGSPKTFSFAWSRCDASGNGCTAIGGATARLYTVSAADVGHTLRVTVTARNASGAAHATSAPTAIVTPSGCPSGTGTIPIADLLPPARLQIATASTTRPITRATHRITFRVQVTACGGRPVQAATVSAIAIPYNQFAPASARTDANGGVTIVETRQRGFPAGTHQRLLAVLMRAWEEGQPLTAGVSTSRVVAFRISH